MAQNPKKIICLSGKRKSGKDYIAELLHASIPESVIIRISAPIKKFWAESQKLDMDQLMSDSVYKEKYRAEMIAWGEEKRAQDSGYFCRSAVKMFKGEDFPIWIVSDSRRETDLQFFQETYSNNCVTSVRISASDEVRLKRGFVHTFGVDDAESECGLDHVVAWDFCIQNDGESLLLQRDIERLIKLCKYEF